MTFTCQVFFAIIGQPRWVNCIVLIAPRGDMDFPVIVRQRLKEIGTEQRDLAAAAEVTESYISQLMTGKKPPPAPERTDI